VKKENVFPSFVLFFFVYAPKNMWEAQGEGEIVVVPFFFFFGL